MQWAQSPLKVFVDVKFAHRFDSPGCLEVQDPKVTFTPTKLQFSAFCSMSGQRINYVLDIELLHEIEPDNSSYSLASAGRLTITMEKKRAEAWSTPFAGKKPSNLQIWWDMKERYAKEMRIFEDDEEGENYAEDEEVRSIKSDL